jgi:hypothetical protein
MSSWMYAVVQLPLSVSVLMVIAFSLVMSWLANRLIRRRWPPPTFKEDNELLGFTYAVYGLIYGVLLAFTIIVAWEQFAGAERNVLHETTLLSQLWRDCETFTPGEGDPIRKDLIAYTDSVLQQEWPAMAAAGRAHPQTQQIYERLWTNTRRVRSETSTQAIYLTEFLTRMNDLSATRRLRILDSRMEVHGVLWLVLLLGAIPTVGYTLLLSAKHSWVQVLNTCFMMMIVLLGLLVTLSLQYPFTGDVSIHPVAFQELLDAFKHRLPAPVLP